MTKSHKGSQTLKRNNLVSEKTPKLQFIKKSAGIRREKTVSINKNTTLTTRLELNANHQKMKMILNKIEQVSKST
jgi:hypothetical protein